MSSSLKEVLASHTMEAAAALVRREGVDSVRCVACGHRCLIREGKSGICKVRFNRQGMLRVPGGYVAGLQIDPIEKKPFFHAYPGRETLSFGMLGCDFHCGYCQNWVTSQSLRDDRAVALPRICEADELVDLARENNVPVVVSTYNEPLITSEWAVRVFEKAREHGLACGFVSNGNATPEALAFIKPYVSLYKVDLKGFNDRHYRSLGGVLSNILDAIVRIKSMGFWLELVTLVVPGFNDDAQELKAMARFIASVSPEIPWHITAFHPDYKMATPPRTTLHELDRAYEAGKEAGLHYVYPGNLPRQVGERENTNCAACGELVIRRRGFTVVENCMRGTACRACGHEIPGVWEQVPPMASVGTGYPRALRI